MAIPKKKVGRRVKRIEVWDLGHICSRYMGVVFKVIFVGSFNALVSNLISSNISANFTVVVKQIAEVPGPPVYFFYYCLSTQL